MTINPLWSISPVDGRYASQTEELSAYFSEGALIRYRLKIETEYFIALCRLPLPQLRGVTDADCTKMRETFCQEFAPVDAERVKEIEKITNHDVKAVEYLMKEKFAEIGLEAYKEFIHFGLTSQDINNTATPLLLKEAHENILKPLLISVIIELEKKAAEWENIPMLARTHGQAASLLDLEKRFEFSQND